MAVLSTNNPTLLDVAKLYGPDGNLLPLVEMLAQDNEILLDATALEGNLPTGHLTNIRTGIPSGTWRQLYHGVAPGKSTSVQVTDTCGNLQAFSVIDKKLADLNGNSAAWRLSEERAFLEGLNQQMAQALFYGNEGTTPAAFTGLGPRFNSLSAENGQQIVNASGAGSDNASIWFVVWGPNTVHTFYPKGSQGGIQMKDDGEVTLQNQPTAAGGTDGLMKAYQTHYTWDMGLTVRDWRFVSRVANIDVSDLGTLANTKNLVTWMIQASEKIKNFGYGRPAIYCNRTIRSALRLGIVEKVASNLTWETVAGERVMMFDGFPVRICDQLTNTETVVS